MNIDEKIKLTEYNPAWARYFLDEREVLLNALAAYLPNIEHIGSTSICNMPAKPIIDIMIGLQEYPPSRPIIAAMENIVYNCYGECGVPGRMYFTKRTPTQDYNAHITLMDGGVWRNNILFRDHLTNDTEMAASYAAIKRKLVNSGADTLRKYSAGKSEFISAAIKSASHKEE